MPNLPTEPARVLDEDHRGRTEWRVERMRVHRAPTAGGQTRVARWLVYAAVAAVVVALLSLVATAAALWLK
jgi:hypothetical protein